MSKSNTSTMDFINVEVLTTGSDGQVTKTEAQRWLNNIVCAMRQLHPKCISWAQVFNWVKHSTIATKGNKVRKSTFFTQFQSYLQNVESNIGTTKFGKLISIGKQGTGDLMQEELTVVFSK